MPENRIEVLVDGWWVQEDEYGEIRVGDLYRTTKVQSHVTRVTNIKPDGEGGILIQGEPGGRPAESQESTTLPCTEKVQQKRLTAREAQLAINLLCKASDKFGNHGCNDFNLVEELGMSSQKERKALALAMEKWNGDEEELKRLEEDNGTHEWATDWYLMSYIAARIEEEYGDGE